MQASVPAKVLYRGYADSECSEWSLLGIGHEEIKAPPDKGGMLYVAAP